MAKLLSRNEAAQALGVTRQTISNWLEKGLLIGFPVGQFMYVDVSPLEKMKPNLQQLSVIQSDIQILTQQNKEDLESLQAIHQDLSNSLRFIKTLRGQSLSLDLITTVLYLNKDCLDQRTFDILTSLIDGEQFEDISKRFGISIERVCQIAHKGCRKLRHTESLLNRLNKHEELENSFVALHALYQQQLKRIVELEQGLEEKNRKNEMLAAGLTPEEVRLCELLSTKICDCKLSVRTLNCLKFANIETLGDLVQLERKDLFRFRNLGKRSIAEIEDYLTCYGLSFKMNVKELQLRYLVYLSNPKV